MSDMMITSDNKHTGKPVLFMPLIIIIVLACLSFGVFLLVSQHYMNSLFEDVEKNYRQGLVNVISVARNAIEPELARVRSGQITRQEAIERIRPIIRSMTYEDQDGKNYIYMAAYDGTVLVQPFFPEREMTNRIDVQDINGLYIAREFIKAAKEHPRGSFVRYYYSHVSGAYDAHEKMAYVIALPEVQCYLATGMYMEKTLKEQRNILANIEYASIWLFLLTLVPIAVSIYVIIKRNRRLLAEVRTRKQAEDSLRASRKLLNDVLRAATSFALIATDPGGMIRVFNRGAEVMLGYSSEEMVGKQTPLILHLRSELEDRCGELSRELGCPVEGYRVFTAKAEFEGSETTEWTLVRKDGSTLLASIVTTTIYSEDGAVTGYLGIAKDITKSRQAEEKFSKIFMTTPAGVAITRLEDGLILDSNEGFEEISGWKRNEVRGLTTEAVRFWVDRADRDALVGELKAGRDVFYREFQFRRMDGAVRTGVYSARPIQLSGEECIIFIAQDITGRKQVEEKFSKVFMMAPDMITITRLEDGLVSDVNMGFEDITGWKRSEVIGRTSLDLDFWTDMEDRLRMVRELKAGRDVLHREIMFRHRDGSLRTGIYSARGINLDDEMYLIFVMQDITQLKEAESELREKEERLLGITKNLPGSVFQFYVTNSGEYHLSLISRRVPGFLDLPEGMEAIFRTVLSYICEEDRERFLSSIQKAVETCSPWNFEGRFINPRSGEIMWFQGISTPTQHEERLVFNGLLLDITERKKAEAMFRMSEEKFSKIFMTTPDSIAISRAKDGMIMDVNPSFREFWGWERDEVIGRTAHELNFWVDRAEREYMVEKLEAGLDVLYREFQFRRKDGAVRTGIYSARSIRIADEPCILLIMRDISEQKQAEEKFSKIFMMTPDMISISRIEDGLIADVNLGFEDITGWKRDEVIGLFSHDIDFWANPDDRARLMEELKAGREVVHNAIRFRRKDGSMRAGVYSARSMHLAGEEYMIFVMRDITEQRLAEEMSRLSEEKFSKIFMTTPDCISITSMKDGRIIDVNPSFKEFWGWERAEVIGRTSHEINFWVHDADRDHMVAELEAGRDVLHREIPFRHKDGSLRRGVYSARRISIGREDALIFVMQDITDRMRLEEERRKLETQLYQSQKMDAIGQLAGGVAHDFNNILMNIEGNISLMLMDYAPDHPHYKRLLRVEQSVERGANLTRQLLGFAREGKYEVKVLSINDLARDSAKFFIETRKEIEADFRLQKDVYPVEGDAGQLEQVLLNIYINAGHAMPRGGSLHIQTENVTLREEDAGAFEVRPGDYVKISITDTGAGMDKETLKRIFEPFFTTRTEQGGTGLGLASAYGIIRNHGGFINVYSEPGKGSTFNIYLPSSAKKSATDKSAGPAKKLFAGCGGILLVDDETVILDTASQLLQRLGYMVYKAGNGQEALSIYKEKRDKIDLVILDMIMPGTSGSEVLKALKEIRPDVKIILSSGYSLQGEARNVMEMGCLGFIQKPYSFAQLSGIVHKALNPDSGMQDKD